MGGEAHEASLDMVPPSLSHISPLHPAAVSRFPPLPCIISLSIDLGRVLGTKEFLWISLLCKVWHQR